MSQCSKTAGKACKGKRLNDGPIAIDRQVRITAGILILIGIGLAYSVHPFGILFSAMVAIGMILSGITDSCALGDLLSKAPWNAQPPEPSSCAGAAKSGEC